MTARTLRRAMLGATFLALLAAPVAEAYYKPVPWPERKLHATRYVENRAGVESFAFVTANGRLGGYRRWRVARIASLLKPMLLVAYLRRAAVRDRALTDWERGVLGPMIRRSDDAAAEKILRVVRSDGLYRVARRAGMRSFRFRTHWGWSETSAADQARFLYRITHYVPARYRWYVRRLLSDIVEPQRWGIPQAVPDEWKVFFKGGWSSGTGRVTHQVALLESGYGRIALAVLTEHNPSHTYGTGTIRGVAARLLRIPLPSGHALRRPLETLSSKF